MILADKITKLRKKNGWSQEELADKMNVSRQAVYKWEAAQTTPDLEKILQLGALFGVTTDYLLKDEIEDEEFTADSSEVAAKKISLSDANGFLAWRKTAAVRIAAATMLCIVSVIPLMLLAAMSELTSAVISEYLACGIGIITMLLLIAIAVMIFIHVGFVNKPYEFLDKEPFELEYGVAGMVRERQKAYRNRYMWSNMIASCICVLSPIPLLCGAFLGNAFLCVALLCVTLLMAGAGAMLFIAAGVRWASMQKLLKEGDFSVLEKKRSAVTEPVGAVFWLTAAAIYLGWSFATNDWHLSWIVWPVAGVLFPGVLALCNLAVDKHGK